MEKRFIRAIANLAVALVFCGVATKGSSMRRGVSVFPDVMETESGKRPIFRILGTDERITKEDYLKRVGKAPALPQTQEDVEKRYKQYTEEGIFTLIDRDCFWPESFLMYKIVFSCFEGTSPEDLFPTIEKYVTLLREHPSKKFTFFFKRGLRHSLGGASYMLEQSRDACGLTSEDLFLDILDKEIDTIFNPSGSE